MCKKKHNSSIWMNSRACGNEPYVPTKLEHLANILTHGIWIIPSLYSTWYLFVRSNTHAQKVTTFVYGTSMLSLFTASSIYHYVAYLDQMVKNNIYKSLRDLLHRFDRAAIYIFIAASYFPWFMLAGGTYCHPSNSTLSILGNINHSDENDQFNRLSDNYCELASSEIVGSLTMLRMRYIIWLMAAAGIFYQQYFYEKWQSLDLVFYILMASVPHLILIIIDPNMVGIYEITKSLIVYAIGIMVFQCDGLIPMAHAWWHIFVVYAVNLQYFAIVDCFYQNAVTLSIL